MSVMVAMGVVNMPLVSTFMVVISVVVKMATKAMEEPVPVSAHCCEIFINNKLNGNFS